MTTQNPTAVDNNVRLSGKKSNLSWIIPLILLLAILALFVAPKIKEWWSAKKSTVQESTNTQQNTASSNNQDTITEFSALAGLSGIAFNGRKVNFSNVSVKSLGLDDKVFWTNDAGAIKPS